MRMENQQVDVNSPLNVIEEKDRLYLNKEGLSSYDQDIRDYGQIKEVI